MLSYRTCIIIGAGPAGIAAAIQLKRCGVDVVIIEKDKIGGLLLNANLVENYPGFPKGIKGDKLCDLFNKHLSDLNVEIIYDEVVEISFNGVFAVKTKSANYNSTYCVLATGTKPKLLNGLPDNEFIDSRIFYEIKNMPSVSEKTICILGSGDAAFDYAINLSNNNLIYILRRSNDIKALPLLVERAKLNSNIFIGAPCRLQNIHQKNENISLICTYKSESWEISCDYLLLAIGREPQQVEFKDKQTLISHQNRFFEIGDVVNGNYRQTSICVGDGIKAAMKIFEDYTRRINENNS